MRLLSAGNFVFFVVLLFIMGLSVGVYNGDELKYNGINVNSTNSTINTGINKIIDGSLTLAYEIANIMGKGAVENGINLNSIVKWAIIIFWCGVVLMAISGLIKTGLYIYIIKREIEMSRKERELLLPILLYCLN